MAQALTVMTAKVAVAGRLAESDGGSCSMKTDVFTLSGNESTTHLHEVRQLVQLLLENGSVRVAFKTTVKPQRESSLDDAVKDAAQTLVERLNLFGLDVRATDMRYVQISSLKVGRPIDPLWRDVDVHVTLESDVLHFTEAPWHADNIAVDGKNVPILTEAVRSNRTILVGYTFLDAPSDRTVDRAAIQVMIARRLRPHGFTGLKIGVVRQDWPLEPGGKCRIDVRIEPAVVGKEPTRPVTMGDVIFCDNCGHTTIKDGDLFRCLNCGNEM